MEKMKVSSTERTTALHPIEKLANVQSREDYYSQYAEFMAEMPSPSVTYYNSNWQGISDEWVKGFESIPFTESNNKQSRIFFF